MSAAQHLTDPGDEGDDYTATLRTDLRRLWCNVIRRRAPQVLDAALNPSAALPADEAIPLLQAVNIWFQLTRIIDENAAMRARRMTEAAQGPDAVEGSFAAALAGLDPTLTREDFAQLSTRLSVGPTLTAHPTEAKRVTVLEIHRRIYRLLVSLETQRWTPRERDDILADGAFQSSTTSICSTPALSISSASSSSSASGSSWMRTGLRPAAANFRFSATRLSW